VFISPSKFAADMHKKKGLRIPIVHIPMFVPPPPNLSYINGTMSKISFQKNPYFLYVGRLEKLKGLQDLIPVLREYDSADILVVGNGKYQSKLQNLANGCSRIKFLGALPYEELIALYSNAIAMIVPSLCYETFGQVIIEAFSTKTPVVARDIGALGELLTESGGGFLYRENSQLIEAMETLRDNPHLRNELGDKGYKSYLKYWVQEYYIQKYFELIKQIEDKQRSN
jgi:glycosyltransferase involved in cell wall biosynthesis